jgi:hypothetical protein
LTTRNHHHHHHSQPTAVCTEYERYLAKKYPQRRKITYDSSELYAWVDALPDLSCLVFNQQLGAYVPHNKHWIKQKILAQLQKQAGK